jgi:hypothetical protein
VAKLRVAATVYRQMPESGSPFRNGKPLYLFVSAQFPTEGYGEDAKPNRAHFSLL